MCRKVSCTPEISAGTLWPASDTVIQPACCHAAASLAQARHPPIACTSLLAGERERPVALLERKPSLECCLSKRLNWHHAAHANETRPELPRALAGCSACTPPLSKLARTHCLQLPEKQPTIRPKTVWKEGSATTSCCMATTAGPNCEQAVIASGWAPPLARHTYSVACPARVKDDLPHATHVVAPPDRIATTSK